MSDSVIVAGGKGALGKAVVAELESSGWNAVAIDRDTADLLDPADTERVVAEIPDLRAVVNVVGGFSSGPKVGDAELEDFERMLRLNLVPAFNLAHSAI